MYKQCSIEGCIGNVLAKGLCGNHYQRQWKYGQTETLRPKDWGVRQKHPLHPTWTWMRRSRHGLDPGWHDFWQFVRDIKEKPAGLKSARRDESKPWGPSNFFWREVVCKKERSESDREYHARHMREWAKRNPDRIRSNTLKKNYGITLEEYDNLSDKQNHCCAICGGKESDIDNHSGRSRRLAVDHCHSANRVRGLLCAACNRGLGNFKDDPALLRAAAAYLE